MPTLSGQAVVEGGVGKKKRKKKNRVSRLYGGRVFNKYINWSKSKQIQVEVLY